MKTEISLKAYSKLANKDYDELVINLRNIDFKGVTVIPGQIALVLEFCFINKLVIKNTEDIDFKQVSVMFTNCYIGDFQIEKVLSKNISISLHASMFAGRITAKDLTSFSINNCLLESGVFLLGVPKVEISYTTENIFPYFWSRIFKKRGIQNYKLLLAQYQHYHIVDPIYLNISSSKKAADQTGLYLSTYNTVKEYKVGYKLTNGEEDLVKAKLHIEYTSAAEDVETTISNIFLHSLSLSGNPKGKVSIEHTVIGNWYISNFSPRGELGFYNINPKQKHEEETKIGIHTSNLDKVWFDNVYFGDFDRLSFYRSKFSNTIFTACSFPEVYASYEKFSPIENIHYPKSVFQKIRKKIGLEKAIK